MPRQRKVRTREKKPSALATVKRTSPAPGTTFLLNGRVVGVRNRRGLAGLRVEAWGKDERYDNLIASAVTDTAGSFVMRFDTSRLRECLPEEDLYFKVWRGDRLIHSSKDSALWNVEAGHLLVVIEVDEQGQAEGSRSQMFVVRGRVLEVDGSPISGVSVVLLVKRFRGTDEELARQVVGGDGRFDLNYSPRATDSASNASRPLTLKALAQGNTEIASSRLICYPTREQVVDLVRGNLPLRGPSQFAAIAAAVLPVSDGTRPDEWTDADRYYLACAAGIDPVRLERFAQAFRWAAGTAVPPESFYALLSEEPTPDLSTILRQPREVWRKGIEHAVDANLVPSMIRDRIDAIVEGLLDLQADQLLEPSTDIRRLAFGDLLGTSRVSRSDQKTVVRTWIGASGSASEHWEAVRKKVPDASVVARVQFALQTAVLTGQHLPLMRELQALRDQGAIREARDLIRFNTAWWLQRIGKETDGQRIGVPALIPGADDNERARNYATLLTFLIEHAFPMPVLADRVANSALPGKEDLGVFFANNPEFDFRRTNLKPYLKRQGESAFRGVEDRARLNGDLQSLARLLRITNHAEPALILMADGVLSARQIAGWGPSAFRQAYGERFGHPSLADMTYRQARKQALKSQMILMKFAVSTNSPSVALIPPLLPGVLPPELDDLPVSWRGLFGPFKLCACEQCRSILSPAAYLFDLLAFLRGRPDPNYSAKRALFERRPDIGQIQLSCANTNTPMPYVDLVNEHLERAVAPAGSPPAPQTTWTAEELAANPEHVNDAAYAVLSEADYPFGLPFDLPLEEARIYLEHLGVRRHEVMEAFRASGNDPVTDLSIAAEYLELSPGDVKIISPAPPPPEPWRLWGLKKVDNKVPDPLDPGSTFTGTWIDVLRHVPIFLHRSGLKYRELLDLLQLRFANPKGSLAIESIDPGDPATCDPSKLILSNLDDAALNRIVRFVRLWRKLGWPMRDLDKALTALGPTELNAGDLIELSFLVRLRSEFKLPISRLLVWRAKIDTAVYRDSLLDDQPTVPPLYDELFLNKAVITPLEDAFQLNAGRDELQAPFDPATQPPDPSKTLSAHAGTLAAAVGIDADELTLILQEEFQAPNQGSHDELNLAFLSHICRIVSIARALRLSIRDLLTLKALAFGKGPFDDPPHHFKLVAPFDSFITLVQFVRMVQKVKASRFPVPELDYVLRHRFDPAQAPSLTDERTALLLTDLRTGLQKIAVEDKVAADTSGDLTRKALAQSNWNPSTIERVIVTLTDSEVYEAALAAMPAGVAIPAKLATNLSFDEEAGRLRFKGIMEKGTRDELLALGTGAVGFQQAIQSLFEAPRSFLARYMKTLVWPTFSVALATTSIPASLTFPEDLKSKLYYDKESQQLRFVGVMSDGEKERLIDAANEKAKSTTPPLATADVAAAQALIEQLFAAADAFVPDTESQFITGPDIAGLCDSGDISASQRFQLVLEKVLPFLRRTASESLVKATLGQALALGAESIDQLLTRWVHLPSQPNGPASSVFLDPTFAESHPDAAITDLAFPIAFRMMRILHKIALVLNRLKIDPDQLAWVFKYGPSVGWLDVNALPASAGDAAPAGGFEGWLRLVDLFALRDRLRAGDAVLDETFRNASQAGVTTEETLARISELTGWDGDDLALLHGPQGLALAFPDDYRNERALARLRSCFAILKRLGMPAAACVELRKNALKPEDAQATKQAARSKHDLEDWLKIAKSLRDPLREEQRAALVAYLIAHPQHLYPVLQKWSKGVAVRVLQRMLNEAGAASPPLDIDGIFGPKTHLAVAAFQQMRGLVADGEVGPFTWGALFEGTELEGPSALFEHLLIDVEMSPCMMTSRIKQAISAVQLFVQRVLLGLEPDLAFDEDTVREWRSWRCDYALWSPNVQMFLHPSPYLFPEVRDDRTPLFKELEGDLLRAEITDESAEGAFRRYLQKLERIARLDVVGMYHERGAAVDTVHMFARTHSEPFHYYYRRLENQNHWTPWEKLDLDIEGEHLIPVVWNRRLHLFWALFTKKTGEDLGPLKTEDWEIRLAWSEYRGGAWTPKQVGTSSLVSSAYKDPSKWKPTVPLKEVGGDPSRVRRVLERTFLWFLPTAKDHSLKLTTSEVAARIDVYRKYEGKAIAVKVTRIESWSDKESSTFPPEFPPEAPASGPDFKIDESEEPLRDRHVAHTTECVGTFSVSVCAGKSYISSDLKQVPTYPLLGPDGATNVAIGFRSETALSLKGVQILQSQQQPQGFEFLAPHDTGPETTKPLVFVYEDGRRSFFVRSELYDPSVVLTDGNQIHLDPYVEPGPGMLPPEAVYSAISQDLELEWSYL